MSPEKTSRRESRRLEAQRQQQQQQRWIVIGLLVVGVALVALAALWPYIGSPEATATGLPTANADGVFVATPRTHPSPSGTSLGDASASVTIDVFEDFQCPACKYFTEGVETLVIENLVDTGKARYVFHVYPFLDGGTASEGGESDQAANAAMCANEQGKFWEMHDTIFANWSGENQGAFSDIRLQAMAKSIELDMDSFNACFDAKKYQADIQAELDLGKKMGVNGTPTVFVNGKQVGQPGKIAKYEEIAQAVEEALKK
ncbi:MAG: DsbA family protein [Chloroflexota bacterium]|nr:thioredoxin domain-containing protein [Anaerolineales bacterium]